MIPFFKEQPLIKIATFDIERYKKHRLSEKAANGTINRELAVLSHLFNKAFEWKWINHKPLVIKRLKEDTGRITYLTSEQIYRLIESAKKDQNQFVYPFIVIGLETSMRKMEILSIHIKNIDLKKRVIYIPQAKGGAREQPIKKHLAEFLEGYIDVADQKGEWLFSSQKSRIGHVVNIEKAFKRAVIGAGPSWLDPLGSSNQGEISLWHNLLVFGQTLFFGILISAVAGYSFGLALRHH